MYFIVPAAVAFLIQSILCRRVKRGILRHGALVLPIISVIVGIVTLLTQCGDMFGGLGAAAAVLWFVNACCTAFGYGAAWFVYLIMKRWKNREQGD